MKLVSYRHDGHVRIGAVVDGTVVHLNALLGADEQIPDDMVEFLGRADDTMDAAWRAVGRFLRARPPCYFPQLCGISLALSSWAKRGAHVLLIGCRDPSWPDATQEDSCREMTAAER